MQTFVFDNLSSTYFPHEFDQSTFYSDRFAVVDVFLDSIHKPASSEDKFTSGLFSPRLVMFEHLRDSSLWVLTLR